MRVDGIDHIAINTVNIEESANYYKDVFGFREVSRANMGDCILVYLEIQPGTYLELFDLRGNVERGNSPENRQGLRHIAFGVKDIESWNRHLKAKKADFVMELTRMEPIHKDGILVRDPNGVIVELNADY